MVVASCACAAKTRWLAQLEEGVAPKALLMASARAAAERLRRFDDAWERRLDAPVTILAVSHALTFTEAALALTGGSGLAAARFAVQSAGFVGKLRAADGALEAPAAAGPAGGLAEALVRAISGGRWRGAATGASGRRWRPSRSTTPSCARSSRLTP